MICIEFFDILKVKVPVIFFSTEGFLLCRDRRYPLLQIAPGAISGLGLEVGASGGCWSGLSKDLEMYPLGTGNDPNNGLQISVAIEPRFTHIPALQAFSHAAHCRSFHMPIALRVVPRHPYDVAGRDDTLLNTLSRLRRTSARSSQLKINPI